jgi:hypothetical protein
MRSWQYCWTWPCLAMDGSEVLRCLRVKNANANVIISGGYDQDRNAEALLKLGDNGLRTSLTDNGVDTCGQIISEKRKELQGEA